MGIQLSFLGSSASSRITAQRLDVENLSTESASAAITFRSDGRQSFFLGAAETVIGNWVSPSFAAGEWEIRATLTSGTAPTGSLGTWLPLTFTRSWSLTVATFGSSQCFLDIDFRRVGATDPEITIEGFFLSAEVQREF